MLLHELLCRGRPVERRSLRARDMPATVPRSLDEGGESSPGSGPADGHVAHYSLLRRLPAGQGDRCYLALPGRPPRIPHFMRCFEGCKLAIGAVSGHLDGQDIAALEHEAEDLDWSSAGTSSAGTLPDLAFGAPLAEHRRRLADLLERGRWPRRRALAIETVYELGESEGVPFVVSQYLAGANLGQLAEALRDAHSPLSWSLRLLLLIEASDVLAAQHYAGYALPGLRAQRLRLTLRHGAPLVLCRAYPLRREGGLLVVANPDHPAERLADRWALAAAVLTAGHPSHEVLVDLADDLRPPKGGVSVPGRWRASNEARRVLWDELLQRVHPHYESLLAAYLEGDSGELPLPDSLSEVISAEEVERLWETVIRLDREASRRPEAQEDASTGG